MFEKENISLIWAPQDCILFTISFVEYDRWIGIKMNLGFANASPEKKEFNCVADSLILCIADHKSLQTDIYYHILAFIL